VFSPEKIAGCVMTFDDVQKLFNQLRIKTVEEIRTNPVIPPERADVIVAGTLILFEFMKWFDVPEIVTSERGVRYGIALREWLASQGMNSN
jgi:exopolyphosphatase/guanosine-5'-triphosphate,3'-diphosphate pyrophosphatase